MNKNLWGIILCSLLIFVAPLVEAKGRSVGRALTKSKPSKSSDYMSREQRLRQLANDPKLGRSDRGWIKQELNALKRSRLTQKLRKHIRNPPQMDLAHPPGREAAKGWSYKYAELRPKALHQLRHKLDKYGRKNKERPLEKGEQ